MDNKNNLVSMFTDKQIELISMMRKWGAMYLVIPEYNAIEFYDKDSDELASWFKVFGYVEGIRRERLIDITNPLIFNYCE